MERMCFILESCVPGGKILKLFLGTSQLKKKFDCCSVTFCKYTEPQGTSTDGYILRNNTKPLLSVVVLQRNVNWFIHPYHGK